MKQIKEGRDFIYDGEVKIIYDDGSEEIKDVTANDFEVVGFDKNHLGKQTVNLVYKGTNLFVTETVEVLEKKLSNLIIQSLPVKQIYQQGDIFDFEGLVVLAEYDNQTAAVVDNNELLISNFDTNKLGKQNVIVSFGDFKVEFEIEVVKKDNSVVKDSKDDYQNNINKSVETGDNSIMQSLSAFVVAGLGLLVIFRKREKYKCNCFEK